MRPAGVQSFRRAAIAAIRAATLLMSAAIVLMASIRTFRLFFFFPNGFVLLSFIVPLERLKYIILLASCQAFFRT